MLGGIYEADHDGLSRINDFDFLRSDVEKVLGHVNCRL